MKPKIFFSLIFFFASATLFAQEKETKQNITYSSITEFGVASLSPQCYSFEASVAQGFALNKKHHFGIGIGIGEIMRIDNSIEDNISISMPVFLNYRHYFKPDKTFSPHVNASLGGIMLKNGGGIYSVIATGFRVGKFTLSSGISFLAFRKKETYWENVRVPYYEGYYDEQGDYHIDECGYYYASSPRERNKWHFPLGITLKWGFAF